MLDKKKILNEFGRLYKMMLKNGILYMEDYLVDFEEVPGFGPAVTAMVEGYDENVCINIFNILLKEENEEDQEFLNELATDFFKKNKEKFALRLSGNSKNAITTIDSFITKMEEKYL